jgi:Ca-activated chloride channel family protein
MLTVVLASMNCVDAGSQEYRRENRKAARAFEDGNYRKALDHYEKGIRNAGDDSLKLVYNKAYVLHSDRSDSTRNAANDSLALHALDQIASKVKGTDMESSYHFMRGSIAIDMEDWQTAVDEFKQCIKVDPGDMKARENYVYAKEHLEDQQNQQQNQNNQQNDQQQNDQQQNDQQQNDQQHDQQQDQKDEDDQQDQRNDRQDQQNQQGQQQESKISPQAAQQIMQALQAKERETQVKIEKKKAESMKSKKKEKDW